VEGGDGVAAGGGRVAAVNGSREEIKTERILWRQL